MEQANSPDDKDKLGDMNIRLWEAMVELMITQDGLKEADMVAKPPNEIAKFLKDYLDHVKTIGRTTAGTANFSFTCCQEARVKHWSTRF